MPHSYPATPGSSLSTPPSHLQCTIFNHLSLGTDYFRRGECLGSWLEGTALWTLAAEAYLCPNPPSNVLETWKQPIHTYPPPPHLWLPKPWHWVPLEKWVSAFIPQGARSLDSSPWRNTTFPNPTQLGFRDLETASTRLKPSPIPPMTTGA